MHAFCGGRVTDSCHQEFIREANVMLNLEHPNVVRTVMMRAPLVASIDSLPRQVRLLGVCLSQPMMIVQELVPLGSLLGL